ncbi:MAG: hypothetical protein ACO3G4_01140 [Opitutaceae bacterium]
MKPRLASLCTLVLATGLAAADATSPVDPARRNETFAPGGTVTPARRTPTDEANSSVQARRFETEIVPRQESPLAGRRSPLEVQESRPKEIQDKASHRPEAPEPRRSPMDHRPSEIATTRQVNPPKVARFQESLDAASVANMARFPALDQATTVKLNRFVFRKNPTEAGGVLPGAPVTPAGGRAP